MGNGFHSTRLLTLTTLQLQNPYINQCISPLGFHNHTNIFLWSLLCFTCKLTSCIHISCISVTPQKPFLQLFWDINLKFRPTHIFTAKYHPLIQHIQESKFNLVKEVKAFRSIQRRQDTELKTNTSSTTGWIACSRKSILLFQIHYKQTN